MRLPTFALRDEITIEDYAGSGAHGPVYVTRPKPVPASVQPTSTLVTSDKMGAVQVEAVILVRPEAGPIRPETRITVAGVKYRVVTAYPMPHHRRPTHWEITVARWAGA